MMKYVKNLLTIFFVVSLVIGGFYLTSSFLKQETWAASVSWDGGAGTTNWSDATNWSTDALPTAADDVLIDADVTVDLGSATTINSLVLGNSGGTTTPVLNFTYDASGTSSPLVVDDGSVTIYSGGKITHSAGTDVVVGTVSLDIQTGDLTVSSGGSIDVDGKGYSGGVGNQDGNGTGAGLAAYHSAAGVKSGSGGGGYGGNAGNGNYSNGGTSYGEVNTGISLGSGGGGAQGVSTSCDSSATGGSGGGLIDISIAGTLTIDGEISSDGATGTGVWSDLGDTCGAYAGGGSGGGITIVSDTVTGSGTITSNGGDGNDVSYAGGGSGGRIYLDAITDTFSGTYSTYGGNGNSTEGGPGTLFKDTGTNGELVIDNGGRSGMLTTFSSADSPYQYDTLTISNGAPVLLETGASLTVNTFTISSQFEPYGVVNSLTSLVVGDGGELLLPTTDALAFSDIFPSVTDLTINSGGTVTHKANTDTFLYYLDLDLTNIIVNSGGSIDVDGKGYSGGISNNPGNGPGAGLGGAAKRGGGSGGAYGGNGGYGSSASGGTGYGDLQTDFTIGSGGGGAYGSDLVCSITANGGDGGGLIDLSVSGTLTIDGEISSDGESGTGGWNGSGWGCGAYGGGGSGGTVKIVSNSITGTGSVTANGGDGNDVSYAGGGGGGRIYIDVSTDSFTGLYNSIGGNGKDLEGGAGTVFKDTGTYGELIVDNGSRTGEETKLRLDYSPYEFDILTVSNGSHLFLETGANLTLNTYTLGSVFEPHGEVYGHTEIVIENDGVLLLPTTETLSFSDIFPTVTDLTVNSGGTLTHKANSNAFVYYLDIDLTNITVNSGGSIDVIDKGFSGGSGNNPGSGPGFGEGGSGQRGGGAGGAYAGDGSNGTSGQGGTGYGDVKTNFTIGSGGGGGYGSSTACGYSARGGGGGGLIDLNVSGTLTIDGEITADGGRGTGGWSGAGHGCGAYGGGGGGGAIKIVSNSVIGTGTVSANGGDGYDVSYAGGGGGGRIYIDIDTDSFLGTYSAHGGNGRGSIEGGAGTIFRNSGVNGELLLDNLGRVGSETGLWASYTPYEYDTITISNGSHLLLETGAVLTLNTYSIRGTFEPHGVVYGHTEIIIQNEGELLLPTSDTLSFSDIFPTVTDLTVNSGGTVTHKANTSSFIYYIDLDLENITINLGASINVDGKGYSPGSGNNPGNGPGGGGGASGKRAGASGGAYAGNGGNGSSSIGGSGYGDVETEFTIGSGGGGGYGSDLACGISANGGGGGGLIDLNVRGTLTVDGEISANGLNGTGGWSGAGWGCGAYGGGGAGGGVKIVSNSVTGSGAVAANGGDGNDLSYAGGGGGGRIYIDIGIDSYSGTYSAYGGNGRGSEGGAGTIFRNTSTNGELLLDNEGRVGVETALWATYTPYEYDIITITNGSHLLLETGVTLTLNTYTIEGVFEPHGEVLGLTELIIGDEGTLLLPTTSTLNFVDIFPTVTDLTVNSGGTVTHKSNTDTLVYYIDLDLENLTINSGASLNVDRKGYSGGYGDVDGNGPGPGGGASAGGMGARARGAGAAHAGDGGDTTGATGGIAYGDLETDLELGSGGGGAYSSTLACSYTARGGYGGGLVNLNITGTLNVEGEISADGGSGTGGFSGAGWSCGAYGGGGGGGRVEVFAANLAGSGDISADGGSGYDPTYAGGGGGGVIYVIYDSSTYTGTDSVAGGLGTDPGLDGVSFLTPSNTVPEALSSDILFDTGAFFAGKTVDIVTKYSDADGKSDLDQLHLTLDVESSSEDIEYYATESTTNATDLTPTLVEGDTYIQDITYDIYAVSEGEYTVNENEIIVVWHVTPTWTWIDDSNIEIGVHATDDFPTTSTTSFTTSDYQYENDLTFTGTLTVTNSSDTTLVSEDWVSANESITWTGLSVVYEGYTDVYPLDSDFNVKVEDDEGNFWIDGTSSSTAFEVVSTSQSTTTNSDVHTVSIIDIPTGGTDISSQTFTIKVDADNPEITDLNSSTHSEQTTWYSETTVNLSWLTQDLASGVETVYRYLSDRADELNSTIESSGVITILEEWTSEEFVDGIWYFYLLVIDAVGNEVSEVFQINIDSSVPDIVDVTGEYEGVWQNTDNTPTITWTDPESLSDDTFYITLDGTTPTSSNFDYALSSNTYTFSALEDGEYNIKVRAKNGAGTYSTTRTFVFRYDSQASGVVSNISTTVSSTNRVTLNWTNPTDSDFDRVVVVRKARSLPTTVNDGTRIYQGSNTTYIDSGLNSSTRYYYAFWTYDHIDNRSQRVSTNVTTRDINAPDPVSEFEIEVDDDSEIKIKWKNPESTDFNKVMLYRDDTLIYEGDAEEYIDSLDIQGEYEYVIYAYDSSDNRSEPQSATVELVIEDEDEDDDDEQVVIVKEDNTTEEVREGEKPEIVLGEHVEIQIPVKKLLGDVEPEDTDVVVLKVEDEEYEMKLSEGRDYFSTRFRAPDLEGGYTVYAVATRNGELLSQLDIDLDVVTKLRTTDTDLTTEDWLLIGGLSLFLLLLLIVLIGLLFSKKEEKVQKYQ